LRGYLTHVAAAAKDNQGNNPNPNGWPLLQYY
jgi:hypothetical protein